MVFMSKACTLTTRIGSCLQCAITAKSPSITRLLLTAITNVSSSPRNTGFGEAITAAIWNPQDGLLSDLIDRGADVNAPVREYYGELPLTTRIIPV